MNGYEKAVNAALKYLFYQERTEQEVRKYLADKEFSKEETEKALEYLRDMRYVNDSGFAERYAQQAVLKGKGSVKIKSELKKKGIDGEVLENALVYIKEEISEEFGSERERAEELAKKFVLEHKQLLEGLSEDSYEEKAEKYKVKQRLTAKLGRRLASKGFPQDIIYSVIQDAFGEF